MFATPRLTLAAVLVASLHAASMSTAPKPRARCLMEIPVPHTRVTWTSVVLAQHPASVVFSYWGQVRKTVSVFSLPTLANCSSR